MPKRRLRIYPRAALGLPPVEKCTWTRNIVVELLPNGCHLCISHPPRAGSFGTHCRYSRVGTLLLHRQMYQMKHGPIGKGLVVRHRCDNSYCLNVEHLEVGTQRDNIDDRLRRNPGKRRLAMPPPPDPRTNEPAS